MRCSGKLYHVTVKTGTFKLIYHIGLTDKIHTTHRLCKVVGEI
jgi:hypothetical protein